MPSWGWSLLKVSVQSTCFLSHCSVMWGYNQQPSAYYSEEGPHHVMECSPSSPPLWEPILQRQVRESGSLAAAGHLEGGGAMSQSPSLPLSGGRDFYKERDGNRTKSSKEGVANFSTWGWAQCIQVRQVMVECASFWFSYPGFRLSRLHTILAPWMKSANFPKLGCLKVGVYVFWN